MHRTRALAAGLALVVAIGILGACSSDSKSATASTDSSSAAGNKTAFCATNATISAAVNNVPGVDALPAAFKSVDNVFDGYVADAPSEVKADAQKLVTAARAAASSGDASAFASDASLRAASTHVDGYCGQGTASSSSG